MSRAATNLIERSLAGDSAICVVNGIQESTITAATVSQWEKDLRRLTKIYKDIKPGKEVEHLTLAKFNEARTIYNTFKHNFGQWVFIDLLGMPSADGVKPGHYYFDTETAAMREVRVSAWRATLDLDSFLFPDAWDYKTDKHLPAPWKLTDNEKNKVIRRYQSSFHKAFDAIKSLIKGRSGSVASKAHEVTTQDIAGFHVTLQNRANTPESTRDLASVLETLRKVLPLVKSAAQRVYPKLVSLKVPFIYDGEVDLNVGASYNQFKRVITLKACGVSARDPKRTAQVIIHELAHHVYKHILSGKATSFWEAAIKENYGKLDVELIKKLWTDDKESLVSFVYRVQDSYPDLHLQLAAYVEGHVGNGGTRLNTRQDFFSKVMSDPPSVMRNPVTAYAHKNAEEAFCEALSMYTIYGSRAVYPLVRKWLRVVLPDAKINESAEDNMSRAQELIERFLEGESAEEILDSVIDEAAPPGPPRGTAFRPRKRRYGKRGKTINPYTGKRKDPKLRRIMRRSAKRNRMKRRAATRRFHRSAKGKSFHKKLGKLVARIRRH